MHHLVDASGRRFGDECYGQTISPNSPVITAITALPTTFGTGRDTMSFFFVRVETDSGVVGFGEACDSYGCSYASVLQTIVDDVFAPLLLDQPLLAVEPLADRMRLFTRRRLGDQWVAVQARSAIELALWDIVGKVARRSVSSLIGSVRDRVEVYASTVFLEELSAQKHVDLLAPLLERGVTKVKLRVGPEWEADLATLTEVRSLLGPRIQLMIDGSEIFTLPTAQSVANALHTFGVQWFEEPLPQGNRAGIEVLVRTSPVPIAYGEHLFGADGRDRRDASRATSRTATRCLDMRWDRRGSSNGAGGSPVRCARRTTCLRRPDFVGRQLALRGDRPGDTTDRVSAKLGLGVGHLRPRLQVRRRRHHRWRTRRTIGTRSWRRPRRSRCRRPALSTSRRTRRRHRRWSTRSIRRRPLKIL